MDPIALPAALSINAWTGSNSPSGVVRPSTLTWGLTRHSSGPTAADKHLAPAVSDDWDWKHEKIGWGLVLPDNDALKEADRASATDAPAPIQALLAARHPAPVLRYRPDVADGYLLRYYADGSQRKFSLVGSEPGVAGLPRFLLICASPTEIPWSFQYTANLTQFVGRLDLSGAALERYVDALIADWGGVASDPRAPVVWSVDHGYPDISWLMDAAISRKVFAKYAGDQDGDLSRRVGLFGADATAARLVQALATSHPSLVVTTSHGMTGPLDDPELMAAQLGVPVDVDRKPVNIEALLKAWSPNGAIWYAHACCSAGSDAPSSFADLLDAASDVTKVLSGVANGCGARTAPLPQRLLGAPNPLRAFVGHVEPTFDWTLRDPNTGQPLTYTLQTALYDKLYAPGDPRPIGWALAQVFDDAGAMLGLWARALAAFNKNAPYSREWALYRQLTALDRQHTVILGDPTVALPSVLTTDK